MEVNLLYNETAETGDTGSSTRQVHEHPRTPFRALTFGVVSGIIAVAVWGSASDPRYYNGSVMAEALNRALADRAEVVFTPFAIGILTSVLAALAWTKTIGRRSSPHRRSRHQADSLNGRSPSIGQPRRRIFILAGAMSVGLMVALEAILSTSGDWAILRWSIDLTDAVLIPANAARWAILGIAIFPSAYLVCSAVATGARARDGTPSP